MSVWVSYKEIPLQADTPLAIRYMRRVIKGEIPKGSITTVLFHCGHEGENCLTCSYQMLCQRLYDILC